LLVLGLALLAGQQGAAGGRLLLALLPVSWWLGGSVGRIWGLDQTLGLITTLMVIGVGVLVALAQRVRSPVLALLVITSGGLFGLVNGFTMPAARSGGLARHARGGECRGRAVGVDQRSGGGDAQPGAQDRGTSDGQLDCCSRSAVAGFMA